MEDFQPLSNLLAAVLPSRGDVPAADSVQRELARCWRQQAGTAASHSQPLLFTSGRMVVFAESASWGNEIRHRTHSLTEALTARGIRITAIEVKVLPDSPSKDEPSDEPPQAQSKARDHTAATVGTKAMGTSASSS